MKKTWFILQLFLYKSEGKTVNTYLNLTGTTIKPVVLYACESWEDPEDQNNLRKIEKVHPSLCTQILGVKNNTSSSKELGELGQFSLRISKANGFHHPTIRRRGDIVTTSLCTSQWCCRYVSNETPNDFSVEHHQDVSVVRLHDVLLEHRDDVLRGRNNDVPSVRLHDVANKSQMKHLITSQWYVTKTSQWYVSTTPHYYVPTMSPVSPKWNT